MSAENSLKRLDIFLVENGYASSREIAKKLIVGGYVTVNGKKSEKPSLQVTNDCLIEVSSENEITRFVSRGALKLLAALDSFNIDVSGKKCVDFGASTGGFTDLLLQRGAEHVYAIENGSNQLHPKLLSDPKVTSFDNTNARYINKGFIPLCDIAVMDVSFISQTKLYESVTNVLSKDGIFISLIKPQFEAAQSQLNNGIVKNKKIRREIIKQFEAWLKQNDFIIINKYDNKLSGKNGNVERFYWLKSSKK